MDPTEPVARPSARWFRERPGTLVVACSDGRLQESLDSFLESSLGIENYDRLYVPGGAGALVPGGIDFLRADLLRRECEFLIAAHSVQRVVLLFHAPAPTGPPEAACADYRRRMRDASVAEIRAQQERDAADLFDGSFALRTKARLEIYRAEVDRQEILRYVPLGSRS